MSKKSRMFLGSLCLSEINEQAKKGHSAFSRGKNGKVYFNVCIWDNGEPNKFGNSLGVQLSSTKEKRDSEGKIYIGNAKEFNSSNGFPVSKEDVADIPNDDGLPF